MQYKWENITVEKFLKIGELETLKDLISEEDYAIRLLGIIEGKSEEEILDLTLEEYGERINALSVFGEEMPKNIKDEIIFNGTKYLIKKDMTTLTLGEKISIKQLQQDLGDDATLMIKVLAILIRKEVQPGKMEPLTNNNLLLNCEVIKKMSIVDTIWVYDFFLSLINGLEKTTK